MAIQEGISDRITSECFAVAKKWSILFEGKLAEITPADSTPKPRSLHQESDSGFIPGMTTFIPSGENLVYPRWELRNVALAHLRPIAVEMVEDMIQRAEEIALRGYAEASNFHGWASFLAERAGRGFRDLRERLVEWLEILIVGDSVIATDRNAFNQSLQQTQDDISQIGVEAGKRIEAALGASSGHTLAERPISTVRSQTRPSFSESYERIIRVSSGLLTTRLDALKGLEAFSKADREAVELSSEANQLVARCRVEMAAQGVDVNSGSPLQLQQSLHQLIRLLSDFRTKVCEYMQRLLATDEDCSKKTQNSNAGFTMSPDGRSVMWQNETFVFTAAQAAVVRRLYEEGQKGTPVVSHAYLLAEAETDGRLRDVFKTGDGPRAWGRLILTFPKTRKGCARLAL